MCNEVARRIALGQLREDFSQLKIRLVFPEGAPNMAPLGSVRITDTTVIVRQIPAIRFANACWRWPRPRSSGACATPLSSAHAVETRERDARLMALIAVAYGEDQEEEGGEDAFDAPDPSAASHQYVERQSGMKECWSGKEDSNLRPLPPEDSALPG